MDDEEDFRLRLRGFCVSERKTAWDRRIVTGFRVSGRLVVGGSMRLADSRESPRST
jgi:hypothetical protein